MEMTGSMTYARYQNTGMVRFGSWTYVPISQLSEQTSDTDAGRQQGRPSLKARGDRRSHVE